MANYISDDELGESVRVILSKDEQGRKFLNEISKQKTELESKEQQRALMELKSNLSPDIKLQDQELLQILAKNNWDVVDAAMEVMHLMNVATLLQMFGKEFTKESIQKVLDSHCGDLDAACDQLARDLQKRQAKKEEEQKKQDEQKN